MKYNLIYTNRAVKDIGKLDKTVKKRLGNTILRYKDDPLKYSEKIIDTSLGEYRFRVGDYRVIFDIKGCDIVVLRVGHRKEIYKRK